jgi:mediator of replication checkpoint protein 1
MLSRFYTQTKPDNYLPPVAESSFILETPIKEGTREPLSQLFVASPGDSPTRRRLRKRDASPVHSQLLEASPVRRDAFSELMAPKVKRRELKMSRSKEKSEFIQEEAYESDEEVALGLFAERHDDGEDYDDDDDLDQVVEGLVDDELAPDQENEDLVIAKHRWGIQ